MSLDLAQLPKPRAKPAKGYAHKGAMEVTVRFDPETFGAIRQRAVEQHTSFAEQVRLLVEWGLEAEG